MNCAEFILVGTPDPLGTHWDQCDGLRRSRQNRASSSVRGDQRGSIEALSAAGHQCNALCTGAGALDYGFAVKVERGDLEGRVAEIKAIRCATPNLSDADLADPGLTQFQRFLD